jgi:CheY-like chemotaxis protein
MSQTLVLSVGSDPVVLGARNQVLRSAGYIVVSAISIREAIHLFQEGDFDLIILCHSLPIKDCERLTCIIRASGSRIPIACVSGAALGEHNAFADTTLDRDPVALLGSLGDVLSEQVQTQWAGVSVQRNDNDVALAKKAPRSGTAVIGMREEHETFGFLERTREHASSY